MVYLQIADVLMNAYEETTGDNETSLSESLQLSFSHLALAFSIQFNCLSHRVLLFSCFLVELEGGGRKNRNTREKTKWKIYL